MSKNKKRLALILGILIVVSLVFATRFSISTLRGVTPVDVGYTVIITFITIFVAAIVFGCSILIIGAYLAFSKTSKNNSKAKPDETNKIIQAQKTAMKGKISP